MAMTQDEMKQAVARAALEHVVPNTIIGIGTGSTANYFIDYLAEIKGKIEGTVASSNASAERLKSHGIPVYDLNDVSEISVYIDGADETNRHAHLVKGGGGALTTGALAAWALAVTTELAIQALWPWRLICHQEASPLRPVTSALSPVINPPTTG